MFANPTPAHSRVVWKRWEVEAVAKTRGSEAPAEEGTVNESFGSGVSRSDPEAGRTGQRIAVLTLIEFCQLTRPRPTGVVRRPTYRVLPVTGIEPRRPGFGHQQQPSGDLKLLRVGDDKVGDQ